jgi:hypothetical protein
MDYIILEPEPNSIYICNESATMPSFECTEYERYNGVPDSYTKGKEYRSNSKGELIVERGHRITRYNSRLFTKK